jgi:twitching motility protein PilT
VARIDQFLEILHERGGSDLHLAAGLTPHIRVRGALQSMEEHAALDDDQLVEMMRELATPAQWNDYESTLDVDFAYGLTGVGRFRVNYFCQEKGAAAVLRIIPEKPASFDDLGAPEHIERFAHLDGGLVLVVGPSGSGKSTTLAAIVEAVNGRFDKHVITIEDPIEFVHRPDRCLISQREIGEHTSSFAAGLQSAVRQNPDVIMVDELHEARAILLALTAAESGVLVCGGVRAGNAARALELLLYAFPTDRRQQARISLGRALAGVIAQRFVEHEDGKREARFELSGKQELEALLD